MEFKRINDTRFQCLLQEEDLEDNNISLDDFFRNDTEKIHNLLDVVLEEAQKDIGIILSGSVMSMQLAPQPNHAVLLTISAGNDDLGSMIKQAGRRAAQIMSSLKKESNVIKREDVDDTVKAADFVSVDELVEKKSKVKPSRIVTACFTSMDDVENFVADSPKTWGVANSLYKDARTGKFYLILEKNRCSEEKFDYLCDLLCEYGESVSEDKFAAAFVKEHGGILIASNAVNIMKRYMA
jgi:adapter protein MecA 1/2